MLVLFRRWGKGIFAVSYCQRVLYSVDIWSDLVKICISCYEKIKASPSTLVEEMVLARVLRRGFWALECAFVKACPSRKREHEKLVPVPRISTWAEHVSFEESQPKTESKTQSSLVNLGCDSRPEVMHFIFTWVRITQNCSKVCICQCWFLCGSNLPGTFCNW